MTCVIFNIPITTATRDAILAQAVTLLSTPGPHQIITANTIMLDRAYHDPSLTSVFEKSSLVIADSVGIRWAARMLHQEIPALIPGIDFMLDLIRYAADHDKSVYLLGAQAPVIAKTAAVLKQMFPPLRLAGWHDGYFTPDTEPALLRDIQQSAPDVLFVGLATPFQEIWINKNLHRLTARIVMGVGGSFDVISGRLKRAPALFRMSGLEWLFRFLQQPWRFRRSGYLIRFVFRILLLTFRRNLS
jgi:N-acetylglucosaminyldiphosphoundecaprenol N-acetyl-beta-D-mannosaminyltransferase